MRIQPQQVRVSAQLMNASKAPARIAREQGIIQQNESGDSFTASLELACEGIAIPRTPSWLVKGIK